MVISILAALITAIAQSPAIATSDIAVGQEGHHSGLMLPAVLVVGGIVGWLAAQFVKGERYGVFANIAIGVIGGVIGGWVFGAIGITAGGWIGLIITAIVGAVISIAVFWAIKHAYP